jgi:hypothetical protein
MKPLSATMLLAAIASLAAASLAAEKPVLIKAVPQIKSIKIGKLSPSFDWITKDGIRAMYGYVGQWNDKVLLQNIVDSGFNTVIVHTMSKAMSEDGWPKEAADLARVANEYKLKVIISWPFGSDERYGNTEFGAYNTGTPETWSKTPCPRSKEYWNKVIGARAVIAAEAKLAGMVVDMEMYGADYARYPGPCYCDNCWGRFIDQFIGDEQVKKIKPKQRAVWIACNGLWEEYDRWQEIEVAAILRDIEKRVHAVNPDFILGNLLDPESLPGLARGFGTASMPALIFSELEYWGNVTGVPARVGQLRDLGYPALYVSGLWVQKVTPPQLTRLVSEAVPPSAGYWAFATDAFLPNPTGDYTHAAGYSNDDYWKAFRTANDLVPKTFKAGATTAKAEPTVPTATVPKIDSAPVIGRDWSKGVLVGPFVGLRNGEPAAVSTTARLQWDGTCLHVRVMCDEPTPEKMAVPKVERDDSGLWAQDSIEVFWTRPHSDRMAHLIINSAGTVADSLSVGLRPESPGWNLNIRSAAIKRDKGWELWLSIPLEEDGGGKLAPGSKIQFEIGRNRSATGEGTCWAPVKGMYKAAPNLWGVLTLGGEKPARRAGETFNDPVLKDLSPRLSWIKEKGVRLGYNYRVPVDWYARAAKIGINGIISRLEIATDPSGDEMVAGQNPNAPPVMDLRTIQPSSRAAKKAGIHFFCMLNPAAYEYTIADGFRDNPRRYNNGTDFSPIDDIYWTRTVENRFLRVAKMLRGDEYQIDGFLIDPELYALGGRQPGYEGLDYGDFALSEFVNETGAELTFTSLSIEERRKLVGKLGLEDKLDRFEFDRLRRLAENTRRRVQRIVPDAILGFFLWRYDNNLWYRAVSAGFSTQQVPCWVGLECTYPGSFDQGLLTHLDTIRAQAGVPLLLSPGTALPGATTPRYLSTANSVAAGNLYHRAINTAGGYWFWSLDRVLKEYNDKAESVLNMLKLVNHELDRYYASDRKYQSPLRPGPFPVERPDNLDYLTREVAKWVPLPKEALPENPPPALGFAQRDFDIDFAVPAKKGDDLSFLVWNRRLAHYPSPTYVNFFRPNGSAVEHDSVQVGVTSTVVQRADKDGVWVAGVSGGPGMIVNAFSVLPETRSAVLVPSDGVLKLGGNTSVFFYVPLGCRTFDISLSGPATARLCDASGKAVLEHSGANSDDKYTETVQVPDDQAGRVWWVTISEMRGEYYGLGLAGIPAVFAARPDQLLAPKL